MSAAGAAAAAPTRPRPAPGAGEWALWIFLGIAIAGTLGAAAAGKPANTLLTACVVGLVVVSYQRVLLAWQTMLGAILVVILFIPIRRYTVGSNLPIELEPYRIVIGLVFACWLCALAADKDVRWRRTGIEAPVAALLLAMLLSMTVNVGRVSAHSAIVIKQFSFFLSYLLLMYFIVSVIRTRAHLDRVLRVLVGGGSIVAVAGLFEWKTGANVFNWYQRALPILHYVDEGVAQARGTGVRARASAQHPIALSAALVMLIPLAVYLYQRNRRLVWLACIGVLTLGALTTGSRTGMTMLISLLVSFICFKRKETVRLLPFLLPLIMVIQAVMPGTLGTMKSMLNPTFVLKEQSYDKGGGAGRVADLGPALKQWSQSPFLGDGFGTRVTEANAKEGSEQQILDDQWLGNLLEIGALGVLALLWLYVRSVRRLRAVARSATGPDGWLPTALAASIISFAVGMLTFDAFAFIQVTFFSFTMMAFAGVVTADLPKDWAARRRQRPIATV